MIGIDLVRNSAKPNIYGTEDSKGRLYKSSSKSFCSFLSICSSLKGKSSTKEERCLLC